LKKKTPTIDALLEARPSKKVARQLVEWADDTRTRIVRGDMMIAILSLEEAAQIPIAYARAAQIGTPQAWLKLASWHTSPEYGEQDLDEAEAALASAIKANVKNAELELVKFRWFFQRKTATKAEAKQAYKSVSTLVDSNPNNAEAIYILALLTTHGFGISAAPRTGFDLQNRAADLGNTDAMFELYIHHSQGLGVEADEAAALEACRRAANAGHSRAMYNMGAFCASGSGLPKNILEAIQWYERSAAKGNPRAMAGLAVIYAMGDGVKADREYAEQMFDQADYCGLDVRALRERVGL
jgi:uncharacterized protein